MRRSLARSIDFLAARDERLASLTVAELIAIRHQVRRRAEGRPSWGLSPKSRCGSVRSGRALLRWGCTNQDLVGEVAALHLAERFADPIERKLRSRAMWPGWGLCDNSLRRSTRRGQTRSADPPAIARYDRANLRRRRAYRRRPRERRRWGGPAGPATVWVNRLGRALPARSFRLMRPLKPCWICPPFVSNGPTWQRIR